jgi:rhodanese-related sulfurtransferase
MRKLLLIALSFLFVLSACQSENPAKAVTGSVVSVTGGSYLNVTPLELKTMLANKDFVFVNVHIPFAGNIANTDLSIPYDEIEQNLAKLPADKKAKIVLYCRSGRMSAIAAESLVKLGYTNLWNLEGGMVAWEQAGYEIQK